MEVYVLIIVVCSHVDLAFLSCIYIFWSVVELRIAISMSVGRRRVCGAIVHYFCHEIEGTEQTRNI